MPFTNWTRAEFLKTLDFITALVRVGDTERSRLNLPGTMESYHVQSMRESSAAKNAIVILGKNHGDNYWLTGTLLPSTWGKLEEELKGM
jgi:hypothetical protein